jgi:hypothetical protein
MGLRLAEWGEWNRKGATLSDVTALKEYGVKYDFIVQGIRAGELEHREGAVWGNPYVRVLRSQLEQYIAAQLGSVHLLARRTQIELRAINKEISDMAKRLATLKVHKTELENVANR